MKILNPSFDTIFKYLLEDLDIAKGFISRILGKEIVDIMPLPQEQTTIEMKIQLIGIPMVRQDFVAAIKTTEKTADGQDKEKIQKVMIEMQKSPFPPEITRFRKYLSEKYHHKTKIDGKELDLPIITVYLIERIFNPKLPPVLYVSNKYYDRLTNKTFEGERDPFVDLLVHEAYFIQTGLLPTDLKNDLLRVLSIFSPKYQYGLGKEERRFIEIDEKELNRYKDKLLNLIIRRLENASTNRKLLTALDLELEYEKEWENLEKIAERERKEKEKALKKAEQERKIAEEERRKAEHERKEKEEIKKRAEEERREKEEAIKQAKEIAIKTAKIMKANGINIDAIVSATGLSKEEIEKL